MENWEHEVRATAFQTTARGTQVASREAGHDGGNGLTPVAVRLAGPDAVGCFRTAARTVSSVMARSAEYRAAPVAGSLFASLSSDFFENVKLPDATRRYLGRAYPALEDPKALLQAAWEASLDARALRSDCKGAFAFPLPLPMERYAGHPVELVVAPAYRRRDGDPAWYAPYLLHRQPGNPEAQPLIDFCVGDARAEGPVRATGADCDAGANRAAGAGASPADVPPAVVHASGPVPLRTFAWLGYEPATLERLAAMAQPECWDDGAERPLGILRNYLFSTFTAVQQQDLLLELPREGFCAFNTGLFTRFGTPIYMTFHLAPAHRRQAWEFDCFAEPGVGHAGKRLLELAGSSQPTGLGSDSKPALPNRVEPPAAPSFPVQAYDGATMHVDYIHLLARLHRVPAAFTREALADDPAALRLLAHAARIPRYREREEGFKELRTYVFAHDDAVAALREHLAAAVKAALARCREDRALAVPSYNVAKHTPTLFVPLWLASDDGPDAVLVATRLAAGSWQVHTVISPSQAYRCARTSGTQGAAPWMARCARVPQPGETAEEREAVWAEAWLAAHPEPAETNADEAKPELAELAQAGIGSPASSANSLLSRLRTLLFGVKSDRLAV